MRQERLCFRSSQSSLKLSMPKIYWSSTRFEFLKIALFPWNRLVILTLIGSALNYGSQGAEATPPESPLRLNELRRMVLEQNDQIQMRMQDAEVSERLHRAEKGIFEPQLVGGAEYFDTSVWKQRVGHCDRDSECPDQHGYAEGGECNCREC